MIGDITAPTAIAPSTVDLIYISTVVHIFSRRQMEGFVREATRLLVPGGMLAIVEIEKKETPFGPPLASRYSPAELTAAVGMPPAGTVRAGEHFYLQLFRKAEEKSAKNPV